MWKFVSAEAAPRCCPFFRLPGSGPRGFDVSMGMPLNLQIANRAGVAGTGFASLCRMSKQNFHLVPNGNRWILSLEGEGVAVGEFESKDLALAAFSSRPVPSTLKIHTADGAILEERETLPPGSGAQNSG